MILEALKAKIEGRPSLDFGRIFNDSFTLFKEVWLQGFIVLLLTLLTIIPFYVLLYVPMIAMGITDPEALKQNEPPVMVLVGMAILLPIMLIGIMVFSTALTAAFLRICKQRDMALMADDDYFYFFKDGRLGRVFILALFAMGLSLLGALACGLGIIYLMVPISLFPAFIAFDDRLSAKEVVTASFTLGNKNWFVIFGLLVVMGFIAQLGTILCFVGVFFTAMLAKVPVYYMYKDGVGFDDATSHTEGIGLGPQ